MRMKIYELHMSYEYFKFKIEQHQQKGWLP